MSKISLFGLLGMIVVACTIGIMYIKPTVSDIRVIEQTTKKYQDEIEKVSIVNQTLANTLSLLDSLPTADSEALKRYLPDTVDEVSVMKDITQIFTSVGTLVEGIVYQPPSTDESAVVDDGAVDLYKGLQKYNFTVDAVLTTAQLSQVLSALEINNYLLQVSSLKVAPEENGSGLKVIMTLTAFSRAATPVVAETNNIII